MFNRFGFFLEVIHFVLGFSHITGQEEVVTALPAAGECLVIEATSPACGEKVVVVASPSLARVAVDGYKAGPGDSLCSQQPGCLASSLCYRPFPPL